MGRRGRRWAQWALAGVVVLMLAQGLAATIRVDSVLARNHDAVLDAGPRRVPRGSAARPK